MAESRTLALKEEIVGRHPAGRHGDRTTGGRHGRRISADITEEEKGADNEPRGRAILRAVGKTAAVVIFACGVGSVTVACNEGGNLNECDSGSDAVDTETEDTDTVDTDTETEEEGPVCDTYDGEDHEAVLAEGENELLGPVGHWMKVVSLGFSNQIAEVVFMNEGWEKVDFEGNVVEEGDLAAYFIFSADNPTLTVIMGGREQEITLCGVYDLGDGTLVAQFITDNEDGFMHCAYVDSGSLAGPVEYAFSETVTQKVSVQTHYHGFIPDVETGEDQECPGTVADFQFERSEFEPPLTTSLVSIPGMGLGSTVQMRGTAHYFVESGVDSSTDEPYLEVAKSKQSAILSGTFQSIALGSFEATWTGVGSGGVPLFSYEYPGATYIAEEDLSPNEKKVFVWIGSNVKEYVLRFSTPGVFLENTLSIDVLSGVQRLVDGGQFTVGTATYDVELNMEYQKISGFVLRPPEETE